jgi:GntR family histidine utilization transcriptional repressor
MPAASYTRIVEALRGDIAAGRRRPGERVPSENDLVAAFGVSRMTANRALRELAAEGLVTRAAGSGTYVAEQRLELSLLRVPDIAEEIRAAGGRYTAHLAARRSIPATAAIAAALELAKGTSVFNTLIVHMADGRPLQLEDRHVNPVYAPDYMTQDFGHRSPNAYLTAIARVEEAEQSVEAVPADAEAAHLLAIAPGEACLRVTRRTWAKGMAATTATLLSPGDRWRLSVRFRP